MAEQNAAVQNQPQQPIAEGESSSNPKEIASITNIYYDCLEHIFDYLDLQSLMNVAATCKRLKIAAAAKFNDDHGEKTIVLVPIERIMVSGIQIHSQSIYVPSLKLCRSFLWSFGSKISHLYFCEMDKTRNFESLEQDINKYCANTLKTLGFRHSKQTFSLEHNQKPFQHVNKVVMENCELHGRFANVNTMFPNLHHLTLAMNNVDEDFSAAVSIPQLESLEIKSSPYLKFGLKEATDLIKANRQLRELEISLMAQEVKLATILDMIIENTLISKLSVRMSTLDGSANADELMRCAAEHPLMIDLGFGCFRMTANDVIVFVSKLGSLKKIQFKLVDGSQYDVLKKALEREWKIERVEEDEENAGIKYILLR